MKRQIIVCSNPFRGSLDQDAVASAICAGIARGTSKYECVPVPVSDGGDGTLEICRSSQGLGIRKVTVADAFGHPKTIPLGISRDGLQAYIEAATVVGLGSGGELKPLQGSTEGLGEAIAAALDLGVKEVFVGLGGSSTVDGGAGCLRALGATIHSNGKESSADPVALANADRLECSTLDPRLNFTKLYLLCDTDISIKSSVRLFGPQKGLFSPSSKSLARRALENWCRLIGDATGKAMNDTAFTGCNGGAAFALMSALNAEAMYGADFIFRMLNLENTVSRAHAVITSEGRFDEGSVRGKATYRVGQLARRCGVPAYLVTAVPNTGSFGLGSDVFTGQHSLFEDDKVRSIESTRDALLNYGRSLRMFEEH